MERLRLAAALLLACALPGCAPDAPVETIRPHVLLILADDLGWGDVGFHGSEIRTPNLDALAASGVRLDRFYVLPACTSTRAALLTGRHAIRHGLQASSVRPHATFGLPLEERTLAEALREAGYRTAILGKWHLGHARPALLPQHRGFDHQYGHYNDQIGYFSHERRGGLDWHRNGETLREEGYATTLVGDEAVRLIGSHDPSLPLFLYLAFLAPHTPLQAPDAYLERYADIERRNRRRFAAMVTALDDAVGRILAALAERGMRRNTLVLFASDNGANEGYGGDNGPLRGGKYRVYEGGVRVPAVASWPGVLPSGAVHRTPVHVTDLYPTLLTLAGARLDQPLPLDGLDAWPAIARDEALPREEMLINASPSSAALCRGDWKLIVNHRRRAGLPPVIELFDLSTDPGETRDLSAANPEVVRRLMPRLRRYEAAAAPPLKPGPVPPEFQAPPVWGVFGAATSGGPRE